MRKVTGVEFEKEIQRSPVPVIVLFTSNWCGSAFIVKGALEEIEKAFSGRFDCLEVNEDECQEITRRYGISHIPTILIFYEAEIVEQIKGVPSRNTIENTLRKYITLKNSIR